MLRMTDENIMAGEERDRFDLGFEPGKNEGSLCRVNLSEGRVTRFVTQRRHYGSDITDASTESEGISALARLHASGRTGPGRIAGDETLSAG